MAKILAAFCLIALSAVVVFALDPDSNSGNVELENRGDAPIVFLAVGDWGRVGAVGANPKAANTTAECNSLAVDANLGEDCFGGIQQRDVAKLMDTVCGIRGCEFVLNTGDNFYLDGCASDDNKYVVESQKCKNRFVTDWQNIYQTDATPNLKELVWYSVLGNHDILSNRSGVEAQLAYAKKNSKWVLPQRWYQRTIGRNGISINFVMSHTSPFITGYHQPGQSYYNDEELTFGNDANVKSQMDFVEQKLTHSGATWDVMVGHHPLYSLSIQPNTSYAFDSYSSPAILGWQRLNNLMKTKAPVMYFNGHDHVIGLCEPTGYETSFIMTGAGSYSERLDGGYDDKIKTQNPWSKYSNVDLTTDGTSYSGFVIVTVTNKYFTVDFYSKQFGTKPAYSITKDRKTNDLIPTQAATNRVVNDHDTNIIAYRKMMK